VDDIERVVDIVRQELFELMRNISADEIDSPLYILLDGLSKVFSQIQKSLLSVIQFLLFTITRKGKDGWLNMFYRQ